MRYTFAIEPAFAAFHRKGYRARVLRNGETARYAWRVLDRTERVPGDAEMTFYGNDGRTVRANAVRWARNIIKELSAG